MTTVIVFAKAPQAGLAKTRLAASLGPAGAARLAQHMLDHAVHQARLSDLGPVDLCVTPDASHPDFTRLAAEGGVSLSLQGDGDLGQRMARAFARVLAQQPMALLIGTDTPTLDATYLRLAAAALLRHDAVFGPAADGGYVLVGLRRPAPSLFIDLPWSDDRVMARTRERLESAGLTHHELATLHDVDEPADLVHVPAPWLVHGPT